MSNPALLALTKPQDVPAAASARLRAASVLYSTQQNQPYPALAAQLSKLAVRSANLLDAAIARLATDAELVSLSNSARIWRATTALLNEQATRESGYRQVVAMLTAKTARHAYSDVHLTQREYIPTAYQQIKAHVSDVVVRIQPGAEPAIKTLDQDPLLDGSRWDTAQLAELLVRWVRL